MSNGEHLAMFKERRSKGTTFAKFGISCMMDQVDVESDSNCTTVRQRDHSFWTCDIDGSSRLPVLILNGLERPGFFVAWY